MRFPLKIHPEVQQALSENRAVVALESTIISHGMPYPQNVQTALEVEAIVRQQGAVPATIALMDGEIVVGLSGDEIERLGSADDVLKVSRRDIAFALSQKRIGATTVASTMLAAHRAGIRVFATGGIGGVHRGAEDSMDISADLIELSQTPVAVVCAGAKSILDIPRTLEFLETYGVPVLGYRCEALPAFFCRDSGYAVTHTLQSAVDIAALLQAQSQMGLNNGVVVANPVPEAEALSRDEIDHIIETALARAERENISGKDITPFLLAAINQDSQGRSLKANIALVKNNATLAGQIAVELSTAQKDKL